MHHSITSLRHLVMAIVMYGFLSLFPAKTSCRPQNDNGAPAQTQQIERDHQGISVKASDLDNGITGVVGKVYINASRKNVWAAITDYNNQKNFVPKLIDSGLISDNGSEQVMFEKGKTGYFLFRKTVYIKLSIRGEYLQRLSFRQIEGDFKVYEGYWLLERALDGKGTILTFKAKIKPDFFAPAMFVRKVQENDLPMVLAAMKKRAESAEASSPVDHTAQPKLSYPPSESSTSSK
ncbi:MAG: cyclase [Chlorobaculum sp.]|nr:cyclase [Chlorobaculum sp.]